MTTLKNIAANFSKQVKKSNNLYSKLLAGTVLLMILSSCSDDNASDKYPEEINTLACKNKPAQISFNEDTFDIVYNDQDKPVEITSKEYSKTAVSGPPVTKVYSIEYNAGGNATKVSKSVNNQPELYYVLEYNSGGNLIKQYEFTAQGLLIATTVARYDDSSVLTSITTHNESTSVDVTSSYQYLGGNLIGKSIQNLYDIDSQEYYNADYTYTYFADKDNKIKTYFDGPLGLLFISNLSNQQSLQYFPNSVNYQLLFASETPSEKKMLKNIEIIAHRYSTQDTTNIDYSYDYDADGFPTAQRGSYKNITRRNVTTPFGGLVPLVTPHYNANITTMNFYCK